MIKLLYYKHEEPKRKLLVWSCTKQQYLTDNIDFIYTHKLELYTDKPASPIADRVIASNLKMETITNSWQAWFHQQQLIDSHVKLWGNLNNSVDFFIFSQPLGEQWYFATEYQPIFQLCHCHFCSSYGLQIKTNLVLDSCRSSSWYRANF